MAYIPYVEQSGLISQRLASAIINLNSGVKQAIYTVPADKILLLQKLVLRDPSGAIVLGTVAFGFNANADDVLPLTAHTQLNATSMFKNITLGALGLVKGTAGQVFGAKPGILQAVTCVVDLHGILL